MRANPAAIRGRLADDSESRCAVLAIYSVVAAWREERVNPGRGRTFRRRVGRERPVAQCPGKSYTNSDELFRPFENADCALWEAGFRLTDGRKPATYGLSGLIRRSLSRRPTRKTATARRGPLAARGGPIVPWRNRRPCCTSLATSAARISRTERRGMS